MNTNNGWKKTFLERLLSFSVSIVILANKLLKTPAGFVIAQQIIKSGTSIGANATEAQDASSTKDFVQKLSIDYEKQGKKILAISNRKVRFTQGK